MNFRRQGTPSDRGNKLDSTPSSQYVRAGNEILIEDLQSSGMMSSSAVDNRIIAPQLHRSNYSNVNRMNESPLRRSSKGSSVTKSRGLMTTDPRSHK